MKFLSFYLLLCIQVFAYQVGDMISNPLVNTLGIDKEKIYIVDFFASWCGSCKKEIPLISKVNTQIDKNKIEIIGVDIDKNILDAKEFQSMLKAKKQLNFRVVNDQQNILVSKFNPIGIPTLYYIKDKKIIGILTGAIKNIDKKIINDLKNMESK